MVALHIDLALLPLKSLFKIRSVTAELLLVWTNVARIYIAGTNFTIAAGICSRRSQEPSFKVCSKLSQ